MNTFLNLVKSKTVWGSVLLGVSGLPQLYDYKDILQAGGTILAGAGVAHKLDKIKDTATSSDSTDTASK